MVVQSPKLDTTLARDELAFITTHLSLKPGPPSIRVSPPTCGSRGAMCRLLPLGGTYAWAKLDL